MPILHNPHERLCRKSEIFVQKELLLAFLKYLYGFELKFNKAETKTLVSIAA